MLVIPPFYYKKPPTGGVVRYYSLLFDALPSDPGGQSLSFPGPSAVPISYDLLNALKHYPNLAGIKDSDGHVPRICGFREELSRPEYANGHRHNLEYALDHGMGAILAEGNLFARQIARGLRRFSRRQGFSPSRRQMACGAAIAARVAAFSAMAR